MGTKNEDIRNVEWILAQITNSVQVLEWALKFIPSERIIQKPPEDLGNWSADRHLFHLLYYSINATLPMIQQLFSNIDNISNPEREEQEWNNHSNYQEIINNIIIANKQIIDIANISMERNIKAEININGLGCVNLEWILSKQFQHNIEHINDIMKFALFWDCKEQKYDQPGT
jgi:hypothetical protein